jgi:hypothetical protein
LELSDAVVELAIDDVGGIEQETLRVIAQGTHGALRHHHVAAPTLVALPDFAREIEGVGRREPEIRIDEPGPATFRDELERALGLAAIIGIKESSYTRAPCNSTQLEK